MSNISRSGTSGALARSLMSPDHLIEQENKTQNKFESNNIKKLIKNKENKLDFYEVN